MAKTLKKWQGWLIFGGAMVIVFVLGLLCSSMLERRAEVVSIFNNRQTKMTDSIVSQNEKFAQDFPREYETWSMTEDTTFKSKYNSSQEQDVLAERPEMVILWAGYSFSRGYNTPRPALYEAWARVGKDVRKASHQEMRSLVCAQCHTEYYFEKENGNYLHFPQEKGMTCEAAEEYYDSIGFYDYIHPLSKAKILKAQHPGYEISLQGIHAQRGVSCADCHMPYISEGGVKYTDHHITSPLANINRTCQTCHRQDAETLRQNVYERQQKIYDFRTHVEKELSAAHIEAKFAWDKGATAAEMEPVLKDLRKGQWRWDYAVASHGAAFHAPQEVMRLLASAMEYAKDARLQIARVVARHGFTGQIPLPDISTKAKAQAYIGLDMPKLKGQKKQFLDTIVPKWIEIAKKNKRFITKPM